MAYVIAMEKLAFANMGHICEMEECRGADFGSKYQKDKARNTSVSNITSKSWSDIMSDQPKFWSDMI